MKQCTKCKESKPVSAYYTHTGNKKPMAACKACHNKRCRAWQDKNPEIAKAANKKSGHKYKMKKLYGLTVEEADAVLEPPCGICGGEATCIDHDHTTGVVRGGLCIHCNFVLGHAFDNPGVLLAAVAYLNVVD